MQFLWWNFNSQHIRIRPCLKVWGGLQRENEIQMGWIRSWLLMVQKDWSHHQKELKTRGIVGTQRKDWHVPAKERSVTGHTSQLSEGNSPYQNLPLPRSLPEPWEVHRLFPEPTALWQQWWETDANLLTAKMWTGNRLAWSWVGGHNERNIVNFGLDMTFGDPVVWVLFQRRSRGTFSKSHRWVDAQATEEAASLSSSRPSLWEVLTVATLLYISSNL